MLKWIFIGVVVLVLAFLIGQHLVMRFYVNDAVTRAILEEPDGQRARETMVVTLADGRVYPVNYLREGDLVFMGIDGTWWRSFRGAGERGTGVRGTGVRGTGVPVSLLIRGKTLTGHARVILDDPEYRDEIFARLRPDVPAWLPDWLNGKLVVIALD